MHSRHAKAAAWVKLWFSSLTNARVQSAIVTDLEGQLGIKRKEKKGFELIKDR